MLNESIWIKLKIYTRDNFKLVLTEGLNETSEIMDLNYVSIEL